jgi:putative salt-induced outer membrane protein YdiY
MNLRMTLLFPAILMVSPLPAREKTDVIAMKNGDNITCEIKSLRSNTLYISVDYILNTQSVDWSKVDHIDSKQRFIVTTQNGIVYTGIVRSPRSQARPQQIEVLETSEKIVTLDRAQMVTMDQTSSDVWHRLNGQIGAGYNYTKANASSQYNLNSDINYVEDRWSAAASYSSNLTSNTGANVKTRNELTLSGRRLLRWNNWYYTGLADFLQSTVQGIQLQSTFGGGVGRNLINTGPTLFTVYGGFAWQRINYQESVLPAHTQQVTSGLLGTELDLFRFDKTTLTVKANLLPAMTDPGRIHFILNTSYYVKLWSKLNWNFTIYGNWDNRPPPGFVGSDYGATSGLSVSFGNH